MKISYNWLQDYLEFEESPEELGAILTEIGLEVEGMEKKENIPGGLAGIVVGEVLSVERHPDADRLFKTVVNAGTSDYLSIVCGAPNVAAGQKVLVAQPGTTLYPTEGEPFEIRKSKIRGEVSEGMICAEDEVGLGTGHEGIMVLDPETQIGQPAANIFEVTTDYVYDIGLTPNRSDATSHLGVAKDLAAALTIRHGKIFRVRKPDVSGFHPDAIRHDIGVLVAEEKLCPRYTSVTISDLTIGPAPKWMADRLAVIGVRSINNIVDITNFILHELGQPLHAFDLQALKGSQVYVERLPAETTFTTLDEVERSLHGDDLMICNAKHEPMCIAGVFGGLDSGVNGETKDVFLESAHFDSVSVRKSSMFHNLRTDAARIFEKGSDPSLTKYALQRAALLLKEYAGGTITSEISDVGITEPIRKQIRLRLSQVHKIIGVEIPEEEVLTILDALDMEIVSRTPDELEVAVPTDKADVTREADLIEEILRIHGFDNIPADEKLNLSLHSGTRDLQLSYQDKISSLLCGMGFSETMALSFSLSDYLPATSEESLVRIHNTSNQELEVMRPTMISSALAVIDYNRNRQNRDLQFFEFGRTYEWKENTYSEKQHLTITLSGDEFEGNWIQPERPSGFFYLKSVVGQLLSSLNIEGFQESPLDSEEYEYGVLVHRGPVEMVRYGAVNSEHFPDADIRSEVFFADFEWDALLGMVRAQADLRPVSRFPVVERDLALIVSHEVSFAEIEKEVIRIGRGIIKNISLFDVYENERQLGEGKRSYGIKMVFSDMNKTLSDKEVDKLVSKILDGLHKKYGIYLR